MLTCEIYPGTRLTLAEERHQKHDLNFCVQLLFSHSTGIKMIKISLNAETVALFELQLSHSASPEFNIFKLIPSGSLLCG